jgi:hypothetical protein
MSEGVTRVVLAKFMEAVVVVRYSRNISYLHAEECEEWAT